MKYKLHTENFGGNLHDAASAINRRGWAKYLVSMQFGGSNTVAVFKMPASMVKRIRLDNPSYVADVNHDDAGSAP